MKVLIINTVGLLYDGITSVIMSYLNAMDLDGLDIYIAATVKVQSEVKEQFEKIGCKVICMPSRKTKTMAYALFLLQFIRKNKIQVVHAHGNSATLAIEMSAAWLGGCKKRIAHSHNTRCNHARIDKMLRPILNMFYTDAFACGDAAGKWLFGNKSYKILNNGREIGKFSFDLETRMRMRTEYNLTDELVIGHVGGFYEQKNHKFLLKIYREILSIEPNAKLFMIGDGPLKNEIAALAADMKDSLVFTGNTNRVVDLLQAMDGMLLPSLFEGLPLVAIEWQINGLPCVLSDTITRDCAITNTVEFMSLNDTAVDWAKKILYLVKMNDRENSASMAPLLVKKSGYDIEDSAKKLRDFYLKE